MAQYDGKYKALQDAGNVNPYPSGHYNAKINIIIEETEDALVASDQVAAAAIPDGSVLISAEVMGDSAITVDIYDNDGTTQLNIGDEVNGNEGFYFEVDGVVALGSKLLLKYTQN